ncbi:cytochrome P450 [Calocera cornea HHB12733]|uniref:Cytochrome P450 n=1 Tax=Calocera cornea HHB12733 TaxID=1353952 RepID=A0A165FEG9_9BASI|nr:cytochrome P450 [Calocera cornea HHB12733]
MVSTAILIGVALLVVTVLLLQPDRYAKLPPGPPGLPLLGNVLQLPASFMYLKLHEWSQQYGPIFSFNAAGQRVVVVSSAKVAGDVLDRLSAYSSNRPRWYKLNDYLSAGGNVVTMSASDTWRRLRKAVHEVLNVRNVNGFRSMQEEEAAITIHYLLKYPQVNLVKHFHRTSASIIWRGVYGGNPLSLDGPDPSQRVQDMSAEAFKAGLPGNSLMDMFPPLRHLYANSKWLRKPLDDYATESTNMFVDLYAGAKDAWALGEPCISNNLNKLSEDYGISQTSKAWTSGVVFSAGQDTTATALRFFALAMLLHPEVMLKAQTELDVVVGDRMPTFEDKEKLLYITAIAEEVTRWHPPAPGGVPHAASEDFVYEGYVIPRGTWIIDNIWSQTRDPALYDEADTFDPSRFLDAEGCIKAAAPDSHDDGLGFGHGRRICPGRDLAANSLFISIACLLWAFEFRPVKGEAAPEDIGLVDNFITVQPAPFKVDLVPRFRDLDLRLGETVAHLA